VSKAEFSNRIDRKEYL